LRPGRKNNFPGSRILQKESFRRGGEGLSARPIHREGDLLMSSPDRGAKKLFLGSLQKLRGGFLEVVCPKETWVFGDSSSSLRAMAVIHDERFFGRAVTGGDVGIGESYVDGDWSSPNLVALVRLFVRNLRVLESSRSLLGAFRALALRLDHRLHSNTLRGARRNIRAHYDLGNDLYRLFLDSQLVYSCAYFRHEDDSLELAQIQKLDVICRKLRIEPGDRLLEIGCGWGAFALHAARYYGAHVTALTLSSAQHRFVAELLEGADVASGCVRVLPVDYRSIGGQFDKIVSIEMFEAVGFDHYDEFFSACDRLLAPDGSMLLQTITIPDQEVPAYRKRVDWLQTYIFPGSELASLQQIERSLANTTRLALCNLESFGLHYARTLAMWRERFFEHLDDVRRLGFSEQFLRMWDFYLAWCEGAFRERYINVAQLVLAKIGTPRHLLGDPIVSTALPSPSISS
jgi:cyclopropane-fatty-acyl-phospholipid synthase